MAIQPATTHSNQRTVSVSAKQEIEYDRYFIQKPVNASDQFSNMFIIWIGNYEHGNPYAGGKVSAFHIPSTLCHRTQMNRYTTFLAGRAS